jgi:hypothetical protein
VVSKIQSRNDTDPANALSLVEQALEICDKLGYDLVAIDLCAAAEKLRDLNVNQANVA